MYQSQSQAHSRQPSNQSEVQVSSHGFSLDQLPPFAAGLQLHEQPSFASGVQGIAALPLTRQPLQDPSPYGRTPVDGLGSMQAAAASAYAGHVRQDQQEDAGVHSLMQPMPLADRQICFEAPDFGAAPTGADDTDNHSLDVTRWPAGEAHREAGWHGAAANQAQMPVHSAVMDSVHAMPQPASTARQPADGEEHNCFVSLPQQQAPHQSDPSAAASVSVGLLTAPQLANSLGDKLSSLERLRRDAAAAHQQPDQLMGLEPDVLSAPSMTGAEQQAQPSQPAYDMASLSQSGSQPSSQSTVEPHSSTHMLTFESLSGSKSPSALAELPDLADLRLPDSDCYDDDLIGRQLALDQTAGTSSGGQDVELVQAKDAQLAISKRGNACSAACKVRRMKVQFRRDARKLAPTGRSKHKAALDSSYHAYKATRLLRYNNKHNGFDFDVTTAICAQLDFRIHAIMDLAASIKSRLLSVAHACLKLHSITNHPDLFWGQPLNTCMMRLLMVACAVLRGQFLGYAG